MGGLLLRIKNWWETADRTQRAVTAFGSLFLVLLLAGTFYFASKPHMAIVFSNLDSAEVGTVSDEIQKMGIPVEYDVQGNVQVPSDKVAEVKAKLAMSGKLPAAGHEAGMSLKDMNPLSTPAVEQVRLQKIAEENLAESIQAIHGVDKADVHLSLGDKSPFADESKPPTASVLLHLTPDAMFTQDQGHAVAMLVANSVSGLSPSNVVILDDKGQPIFDGTSTSSEGGVASEKIQQEIAETNRRERELQGALDQTFGRGTTLVKVNLELDYDKTEIDKDLHPQSNAIEAEHKTQEVMNGDNAGSPSGLGGMISNLAPAATGAPKTPPPAESGKSYTGTTSEREYVPDEIKVKTDPAVGTLKSMAITALVNSNASGNTPAPSPTAVEQFLQGYMKPWDGNKAFSYTVTPTAFDTTTQNVAENAQKDTATRERIQQGISLLPVAALLVVGFLVMRSLGKAVKPLPLPALPSGQYLALQAPHDEALVSTSPEALAAIGEPAAEIGAIQERLNLPLEQIKKMSDEKSENVAMLMKTWMLEDHR